MFKASGKEKSTSKLRVQGLRFKVFIIMHYFNGLQQKEIAIYKKSNIKTALNYINVKSKMCAKIFIVV